MIYEVKFKPSSSSPVTGKGGIDLRALPITTQKMQVIPGANAGAPFLSRDERLYFDDAELVQIKKMIDAEMIPSTERIKEYLLACSRKKEFSRDVNKVLACIADILRIEEGRCLETGPEVKQFLVLLESNKPADELQRALARIEVSSGEPELIAE